MARVRALTSHSLKTELDDLAQRFPNHPMEDLFVLWFMRAYLTDDEAAVVGALTNGPNDKQIDAVLVDDKSRVVFLVQGKYRKGTDRKLENAKDVVGFAEKAEATVGNDQRFAEVFGGADAGLLEKLKYARGCLKDRRYRLVQHYVTTGRCSTAIATKASEYARRYVADGAFEVHTGTRVLELLRDYLDGVAPPIPHVILDMEHADSVRVNGVMQRFDRRDELESWVFTMNGDDVGRLYDRYGVRLFARNIRGYLGDATSVNHGMTRTLRSEPERFFYYNNGVTVICDDAEKLSQRGKDSLKVLNPQLINGQQTTRTLAAVGKQAKRASVLVKVIKIPRAATTGDDAFDDLVGRIVRGTNWQNAIRPADLIANDRKQIGLERELRKLGYLYLRKAQSKTEARRALGRKQYIIVNKEELAVSVAGCDMDPVVARSGRQNLFEDGVYGHVFPNTEPDYYLPRYWLQRRVTAGAKGKPGRGYAKWLVLGYVWRQLGVHVRSKGGAAAMRQLCERRDTRFENYLGRSIDSAYVAAGAFYTHTRGRGETAIDVSQFYRNRKGRDREFERFWCGPKNKQRAAFGRTGK